MIQKKFKIFFTFVLIYYSSVVYGSEKNLNILHKADSLFEKKQYTESLEFYEELIRNNFYTPKMLIRLSLIKEGLGDYTYALYYLNLYYTQIPDRSVLKKMDELASHHNLEGYHYNDRIFFISLYDQYHSYIVIAFLGTSGLFLIYLYVKRREKEGMGLRPLFFMFILGAVYFISNYNVFPEKGIVSSDAPLMSAPSAGAERIGMIRKGHRVTVQKSEDIWLRIKWNDQTAYIRENNMLLPQ
jgi:tetratricopeptide (TPR) repeat protein